MLAIAAYFSQKPWPDLGEPRASARAIDETGVKGFADAAPQDIELVRIVHVARQVAELSIGQGAELAREALA